MHLKSRRGVDMETKILVGYRAFSTLIAFKKGKID
jgi:hypothetical protein